MQTSCTRDQAIQTLQGIRAAAESALAEGVACICVTVLREHPPSGGMVLLCGHSGPRGELLNAVPIVHAEQAAWRVTARFRAAKLIVFCGKTIETILKAA